MSPKTNRGAGRPDLLGYTYYVSEEQLAQYATLTTLERLTWLDQARQFILLVETEETAKRRARLRHESVE